MEQTGARREGRQREGGLADPAGARRARRNKLMKRSSNTALFLMQSATCNLPPATCNISLILDSSLLEIAPRLVAVRLARLKYPSLAGCGKRFPRYSAVASQTRSAPSPVLVKLLEIFQPFREHLIADLPETDR